MGRSQAVQTAQVGAAPFFAGKNKIINGDFAINQRSFTSTTSSGVYTFDRWVTGVSGGGTATFTPQTFTLGTAPVSGYESTNFVQIVTASQSGSSDYAALVQRIESVRTFAGQTVTVSFWAKTTSGTPKIAVELSQNFGSGGSPSSQVNNNFGNTTISTSWARYSFTATLPSISGKTLGTSGGDYLQVWFWLSAGSAFDARTGSIGNQNNTFQIWGVQLEAGSVATPFTTATGTIQGELAACQRYYWKIPGTNNFFYAGFNNSTTEGYSAIPLPVTMRVRPTTTVSNAATALAVRISGGTNTACNGTTSVVGNTTQQIWFSTTVASGLTAGQGSALTNVGSAEALEFSAEL